ncbi:hypothetical protein GCM10010988_28740 [Cnuibacter physcomitrellae]|uniref:Uncharacterized protein n=1 Tax=Cnuibacter physcomitrellae TaxID=1619308 RepID=A0A1X9LM17_9MICO|nr:hypothetical protein [Cnuibacter physcomitrellae]ARJ04149.1 hypothetical protein B5808_02095 [Cnuibacter physcomitrellae]GGI40370.1 hypothetical protein GCM10010988_28740 [Cnuibacter physcomitrellae]
MTHRRAQTLLAVASALILAGCASAPALSEEDAAALDTLAQVAGPTSGVDASAITSTECWLPSGHLIEDESLDGTTWKVLCRVHYTDKSGDRYQDTTCIGDFAAQPMLDHCYRWAHYDFAPEFGDFPAVKAG